MNIMNNVITLKNIVNKCNERKINFSFLQDINDNTGKTNVSNITGNHNISKMAPAKAK